MTVPIQFQLCNLVSVPVSCDAGDSSSGVQIVMRFRHRSENC